MLTKVQDDAVAWLVEVCRFGDAEEAHIRATLGEAKLASLADLLTEFTDAGESTPEEEEEE